MRNIHSDSFRFIKMGEFMLKNGQKFLIRFFSLGKYAKNKFRKSFLALID